MALPSPGPKNLTIKRDSDNDGNSMTCSWGNPADALWDSNHKWDGVDETWKFNASKNMSSTVTEQRGSGHPTGDNIWVRDKGIHESSTVYYNRSKYHPLTSGRYLNSVLADIFPYNGSGQTHAKITYTFKKPRAPKITSAELDEQTGIVTFEIETDEGKDAYERYDTTYCIVRQDSSNRNNSWGTEKVAVAWASSTEKESSVSINISDAQSISTGQWVKVTCKAYARGLAGDSSTVTKSYVYAYPAQASITSVVTTGMKSTDVVTVRLKTNATATAPVDSIKLQRLHNVSIDNANAAGLAQGWEDVSNAVDDGVCTGLSDYVPDAIPDAKKHTWYRLVTTHGPLERRSIPVEAKCLFRAKDAAEDDKVKVVSVTPGADGSSVLARLAWNNDDSNTTQISWAEYEDAWESTEQPTIMDVTWNDPTPPSGYNHSATVTIRGLEENSDCYIRARRANITESSEVYGAWCYPAKALYPVRTIIAPTDVVLTVPAVVERGNGVDCQWTFAGSEQTRWQICNTVGSSRKELISGNGATGYCTIPASKIKNLNALRLSVSVTCGGDWATSDVLPVTIADAPEIGLAVSSVLESQPLELTLTCTSPRADVAVYVVSRGVSTDSPTGTKLQAEGDVVWAEIVSPRWTANSGAWSTTVTAPATLAFYDGAVYDVSVSATDQDTLLSSDEQTAAFAVSWAHQATCPSSSTTITVDNALLQATIEPAAPTGAAQTDVCDVYRLTPDGSYLIASDVPFGTSVLDRYAPFSSRANLSYRLCTRTVDGDLDWADFPYVLKHGTIRLDWGSEDVELPYNITLNDSWEKPFELREHMDGTRAGYWNAGATRTSGLTTDVMKVTSAEERKKLASLAKHSGAAFVRTPDGCAYSADVQVNTFDTSYESQAVPVSVTATEVALTQEYMVAPSDWSTE